ncbi:MULTISPECIES: copper resistance CopC family protein [Streptosporangium]|uniref:Methionine-rich copper-binding protein CopC n=1 Tax=Streptosporangium brasiliense TaxID=47480 RepID=A0ABT9RHM6_9ACTN|nr:copper resistance protein CopC [Streptosporangium brasiliense]MDP9867850.1 methionine-rich copper-binding protein CopC [Streptosporangium brasiliense]
MNVITRAPDAAQATVPLRKRVQFMFLRRSAILLAAFTVALWPMTAAQAHDVLKSSSPAKDARVTDISEVTLEFNREVTFPKVAVVNAAGKLFQSGQADLRGKRVIQKLSGPLPAGTYTIVFGWSPPTATPAPVRFLSP